MRVERSFDPKKEFFAKRSFKYAGKDYSRGDSFPSRDISNKQILKFFQNGFVGYSEDFRDNKSSIKEVEIQKPVEEEKPKEEVSDSPVEDKPKPQKSYRKPRTSKKKSEDSAGDTVSDTKS